VWSTRTAGGFPVQQQGALALALGPDVLHQREQAVGRVGTARTLLRLGVGLAHRFHGDVDGMVGHGQRARPVDGNIVLEAQDQALAQQAHATRNQIHGDADAGVDLPDVAVGADQGIHVVRAGLEAGAQPALECGLERGADLIVGQELCARGSSRSSP
jgi:hypothetical protein